MKIWLRTLALGMVLLTPAAAHAAAPSLSPISDLTMNVDGTTTVNVVALDLDGDPITLTSSLPGFAVLNEPTSGSGIVATTITLNPLAADAGPHNASVTATAGAESDTEEFVITVGAAGSDLAPAVTAPGTQSVTEGDLLSFIVTAADPDQDAIASLTASPLPAGATFTPNGTYTAGNFTWTPTTDQSGSYDVVFTAMNALSGSASTSILVLDQGGGGNQCPVLAPIGDQTVDELSLLTFSATATDPDDLILTFSIDGAPAGATMPSSSGCTDTYLCHSVFNWTPTEQQGPGTYTVTIRVSDLRDPACEDSETLTITVNEVGDENQCPVLSPIGNKTVNEFALLTFTATATDPDAGQALTFSLDPGFPGDPGNPAIDPTTGVFTFTPTEGHGPGTYQATIRVSDAGCDDFETIAITVNEVDGQNNCPVLAAIGDKTVTEGQLLTFTATATDADAGQTLTFSLINLIPAGAAIDPVTGVFTWTPTQGPAATDVTIQVSDNATTPCMDSEIIHVTVNDAGGGENTPPVVEAPASFTVDEGNLLSFDVTATDADTDTVQLTVDDPPFGSTFVDHGNNTGTFSWTPSSNQSGNYTITFRGDDGNGGIDTDTTAVTVNDVDGGGDFEAEASMMGRYNAHRKYVCFRITTDDDSFDLRDVDLSSLVLSSGGSTLDAVSRQTHLATDCDECFECEDDDHDCDEEEECEAAHIRVCFLNADVREMYDGDVLEGLRGSEIHGTLDGGQTFVASLGGKHLVDPPGNGNGNDGDDDQADRGGKKSLKLQVRPNPLNPKAEITFTLAQAGQVRIALYDLRGRLVKTILDGDRGVGDHVVSFDTSSGSVHVASGVYFLKIEARQGQAVQRVTVLK